MYIATYQQPTPIIDVCGTAYDAESWRANLLHFAEHAPGYLQAFGPAFAQQAGVSHAEYRQAFAHSPRRAVDLLTTGGGLGVTAEQHVRKLCELGVRYQVLFGSHTRLPDGSSVNDRVARMAQQAPDMLEAWAALDLADPRGAVAELERCVETLGMKGATLIPFTHGTDPDSPACHEIYGRAAELGVPLWIHTGLHFASERPLVCTWMHLDRIAVAHPRLVILAGHGGWPWILEAMGVLQRHPNVYLEFSAHRPKYMGRAGSGWEPMLFYGRTLVRNQILFGSSSMVHRLTPRELAEEVEQLGLEPEVSNAWLHGNAARLLRVEMKAAA